MPGCLAIFLLGQRIRGSLLQVITVSQLESIALPRDGNDHWDDHIARDGKMKIYFEVMCLSSRALHLASHLPSRCPRPSLHNIWTIRAKCRFSVSSFPGNAVSKLLTTSVPPTTDMVSFDKKSSRYTGEVQSILSQLLTLAFVAAVLNKSAAKTWKTRATASRGRAIQDELPSDAEVVRFKRLWKHHICIVILQSQ